MENKELDEFYEDRMEDIHTIFKNFDEHKNHRWELVTTDIVKDLSMKFFVHENIELQGEIYDSLFEILFYDRTWYAVPKTIGIRKVRHESFYGVRIGIGEYFYKMYYRDVLNS